MRIRVTSQMLNNNKRRTGMSSDSSSLVNHLTRSGTGGSSRIASLNADNKAGRVIQSNYKKLEETSERLAKQADQLAAKVDGKENGFVEQAQKLAESYNDTLKNLKQTSGVLNQYYHQSLRDIAFDNKTSLAEIGITVSSDGTVSVNREKLESADREKVEKLLGSEGDFLKKVSFVGSRIADNAKTNVESVSGRYNARGNLSNSYLSKINYRR